MCSSINLLYKTFQVQSRSRCGESNKIVFLDLENAVLTISPTALTINESDSITFTCTVDTNLNPVSYSFQRDGNGTTTDGNEYVISKVMKSDSGSYTCIVSASASTTPPLSVTSDPVLLTVNGKLILKKSISLHWQRITNDVNR